VDKSRSGPDDINKMIAVITRDHKAMSLAMITCVLVVVVVAVVVVLDTAPEMGACMRSAHRCYIQCGVALIYIHK
jgi:hypothetical protein